MSVWHVEYSPDAQKAMKKLDSTASQRIYRWMDKNIEGCSDPRAKGKGLTSNLSGLWRYRVTDWRIMARLHDNTVTVEVVEVAHRSKVYKKHRH